MVSSDGGGYPSGECTCYEYQADLDAQWMEICNALEEAEEAASETKGKRETKKAQESTLVERGESPSL